MKFSERLKALREQKGLTQEALAKQLNISRQSVSKWERGISEPDFATTKALCKILECSIGELIDPEGTMKEAEKKKAEQVNKKVRWLARSVIIITIFSALLLLAIIFIAQDEIIIHFGIDGTITRGSRWTLLLLVLIMLLCPLTLLFIKYPYPRVYQKQPVFLARMSLLVTILIALTIFITVPFMIQDAHQGEVALFNLLNAGLYAVMIAIGPFTHPKFNKFNHFFGFRTNFTFASEENWNKVNAFTAISMTISAMLSYIFTLILITTWTAMWSYAIFFAGLIASIIYHEILRFKHKKQINK